MKSGFSSLGTTILRSPGPLALYIIVDVHLSCPMIIFLKKKVLFVFFEQQVTSKLLQVSISQFVRHPHIYSVHITGVSDMRHASVQHTKNFLDFSNGQMWICAIEVMILSVSTVHERPDHSAFLPLKFPKLATISGPHVLLGYQTRKFHKSYEPFLQRPSWK